MEREEWLFAGVISGVHAVQHVFLRLVPPLIPLLAVDLGLPFWQLGLLVGLRSAVDGVCQTPVGMLSDAYDRRLLLATGMGVMGAGFALFGLAPALGGAVPDVAVAGSSFSGTYVVMFIAVAVAGVGSSAVHPTGYPLITANISPRFKGRALGMWGSASSLGDATVPLLVGVFILVTAWEVIVVATGLLGVAYAVVLFVVLGRESFVTTPPAMAPGTGAGAVDGEEERLWDLPRRVYLYPMLAVFLFFGLRSLVTGGVTTFVPAFLTETYAYTLTLGRQVLAAESVANFYFSGLLLTAGLTQLVAGELADRHDPRAVILGFLALAAAALVALSFVAVSPGVLLGVLLLLGAGLWGVNPARDALISQITPADREGRTFGYLWTGTLVVGAVSPVVIGYVGDVASLRQGFQLLAGLTVVTVLPVLALYSRRVYASDETTGTRS